MAQFVIEAGTPPIGGVAEEIPSPQAEGVERLVRDVEVTKP
jgi:hypothetical protein